MQLQHRSNAAEAASSDTGRNNDGNRLSLSDYVAIGVCVGFLLLVYVVAIAAFLMIKRRRRKKEQIRQQFLLPPSIMPPGLGIKSSRILGLEDAFVPELRRIEPLPNMSEANLARLQRRRQALEEARMRTIRAHPDGGGGDDDISGGRGGWGAARGTLAQANRHRCYPTVSPAVQAFDTFARGASSLLGCRGVICYRQLVSMETTRPYNLFIKNPRDV